MSDIRELFKFTEVANGNEYFVTSGQTDIDFGGNIYQARPLNRGKYDDSEKMQKQNLIIKMSLDDPIVQRLFSVYTDTLFEMDFSEYDTEAQLTNSVWIGRLIAVNPMQSDCELKFESIYTSMRRLGAAAKMTITCRHALFGEGCGLNRVDFETVADVTDLTGLVVTATQAANEADGFYSGGTLRDSAGFLRRISSHVGTQLTLSRPINSLIDEIEQNGYAGLQVNISPGCPKISSICDSRFGNLLNFGGFEYMPFTSPFEGSVVKEIS